jgi:hypothetical protein
MTEHLLLGLRGSLRKEKEDNRFPSFFAVRPVIKNKAPCSAPVVNSHPEVHLILSPLTCTLWAKDGTAVSLIRTSTNLF